MFPNRTLARNECAGTPNRRAYIPPVDSQQPQQPANGSPSLYGPTDGGSELEKEIEEWLEELRNQTTSADTRRSYQYAVRAFVAFAATRSVVTVEAITRKLVTEWYETFRKRGIGEATLQHHSCAVRSFLRYCRDVGYVDRSMEAPTVRRKAKRIRRALNEEQVAALLSKIGHRALLDIRDRAAILFLLSTGCRASELCNTELENVRFYIDPESKQERAEIRVIGKGDKERLVWLTPSATEALRLYITKARRPVAVPIHERALFLSREGQRLHRKTLSMMVRRRCDDAGLPGTITSHWLRHTFATSALGRGVDLFKVSKMLGHSNLETTAVYLHVEPDEMRRAHKLMDDPPNLLDHLGRVGGAGEDPPKPLDDHRRRRR